MDLSKRIAEIIEFAPSSRAIEDRGRWWTYADIGRVRAAIDAEIAKRFPGTPAGTGAPEGTPAGTRMPEGTPTGTGAPVGVILRTRFGPVSAQLSLVAGRRCLVPFSPMFGDAKLADEIRAQRVPILLADAEDLARPGLKEACEAVGTAAFALAPTPEEPLRPVTAPAARERSAYHDAMPGVAVRMLTSGTTGTPKRISLTYAELDNMMAATAIYSKRSAEVRAKLALSDKVEILNAPLVHTSGFTRVLMMVAEGNPVSLLEHFDPETWSKLVEAHRPIAGALVPAAMRMLLDAKIPKERLATLRVVACGTAALDPDVADEFTQRYGIPVIPQYGATEFPGGLAGWTLPMYKEWWTQKRGSVGRAKTGVEFRVVDPESKAVQPSGSSGLIAVRTPGTRGRGDDGFITTADVGRVDEDGFLYVSGRADDAIIRGGFKILPGEVEKVLEMHPAVRAAGVIGRPDARLGAVPVAAVELSSPATPAEILEFVRDKLAKYQVPVEIRVVDALPRTPSLKVAKPQLRELLGAKA